MSSRGKKLVKLALNEKSGANEVKDKARIYDNLEEEDPWIYFKEWQANRECRVARVENAECDINRTKILQELTTLSIENEKSEGSPCKSLQQDGKDNINDFDTYKTNDFQDDISVSWHPIKEDYKSESKYAKSITSGSNVHREIDKENIQILDSSENVDNKKSLAIHNKIINNETQNRKCVAILSDILLREGNTERKKTAVGNKSLQQGENSTVSEKLHDVSKLAPEILNQDNKMANSSYKDNMNDSGEFENNDFEDSSVSWHPDKEDCESESEDSKSISSISSEEKKIAKENIQIRDSENVENKKVLAIHNTLQKGITAEQRNTPKGKRVECSLRKGRVWDKKDRCLYCNLDVTNFSRHLFRKHPKEDSVQRITELAKGDCKRKHMIDLLRKQGNFSIMDDGNIIRPVQRPTSTAENQKLSKDYLPCKYCKGLYKIKSLKRHAKICFFNSEKKVGLKYASEGQTMVAFTASRQQFLDRLRLKSEVFHTMQADRISLNGKGDTLICQYAEDYLRKHKRPHIKNAVSNKVRELGRLLIPLQDNYGINSMLEALKPEHYDKVVAASRIISGYNEATRSFEAASLALHMRTSLLAVCAAAKSLLLKKDPVLPVTNYEEALKNVKRFAELVASNWKFAMGSLALKDLNEKHSAKPQTLPVTEDIISFRNYTRKTAETCMTNLKQNINDVESFKTLTEAALALTIVLNRKRVGDVQYTKLESYNRDLVSTNQEECLNVLTESEVALSKHFKRIITIGKGSKPVPILFSTNIQEYMETLLSVRSKTDFVPEENPFLFALTGSSSKWVDGSAILRKFATNCGAKNPSTLTSSRLRKQIATVLQILNLNEAELEQVATFMGHTKKTHEEFYRLPQDVFQTGKIAKLLLMMEKGVGAENKGRTLNDIDVELEMWSNQDQVLQETPLKPNIHNIEEQCYEDNHFVDKNFDGEARIDSRTCSQPNKKTKVTQNEYPKKDSCRGSWTGKQKSVMLSYFKSHLKNKKAPKKNECMKFIQERPDLFADKKWLQIKVFVYNSYRTL